MRDIKVECLEQYGEGHRYLANVTSSDGSVSVVRVSEFDDVFSDIETGKGLDKDVLDAVKAAHERILAAESAAREKTEREKIEAKCLSIAMRANDYCVSMDTIMLADALADIGRRIDRLASIIDAR
jgi:hypothetical protein